MLAKSAMNEAQSSDRVSRLAPLSLQQRIALSTQAVRFFSPMFNRKVCDLIGKLPQPGGLSPLHGGDFLKYLECSTVLPDTYLYTSRIRELLNQLEAAGLLTATGHPENPLFGKYYVFLKELTWREKQGNLWLAKALGPDLLHRAFQDAAFQIVGSDPDGIRRAGTALLIRPNWLLTCAQVVTGMDVREAQVFRGLAHRVEQTLRHPTAGIALMRIDPGIDVLPGLAFRDPEVAETLFAFGYPKASVAKTPSPLLQRGEVVATGVKLSDGQEVFLCSAVARPATCGGPILSETGQVLGIATEPQNENETPFFAGIASSTIAAALAELEPSVVLPIENYA